MQATVRTFPAQAVPLLCALPRKWCYAVVQLQRVSSVLAAFLILALMSMRPCRHVCQTLEHSTRMLLAPALNAIYASVQTCEQNTILTVQLQGSRVG